MFGPSGKPSGELIERSGRSKVLLRAPDQAAATRDEGGVKDARMWMMVKTKKVKVKREATRTLDERIGT